MTKHLTTKLMMPLAAVKSASLVKGNLNLKANNNAFVDGNDDIDDDKYIRRSFSITLQMIAAGE